jgi:hypothetical protein
MLNAETQRKSEREVEVSAQFIDLTTVANVVEIDATVGQVEFVQNAVVADSQLEFGPALEALVGKLRQPCTHFIQFLPNCLTGRVRQRIECFGKRGRPNLKRGRHRLFWLAGSILPGRNFAP